MQYRFLDDNIGYIRCSSFGQAIGEGNIDEILFYLAQPTDSSLMSAPTAEAC